MQTASSESNYAYIKQNYSKEWYVGTLDYHVLNWNIDKLKQLIIEYNCKSCKIPIKQLEYQYNAPSRRKIDYYKQSDNYTPIIVVPHMEYLLVVDGNHRLQARIELKKVILMHILSLFLFIQKLFLMIKVKQYAHLRIISIF